MGGGPYLQLLQPLPLKPQRQLKSQSTYYIFNPLVHSLTQFGSGVKVVLHHLENRFLHGRSSSYPIKEDRPGSKYVHKHALAFQQYRTLY